MIGTGCVKGAKQLVITLFASAPAPIALRAASALRQQWTVVALPTPSLDGGLGSDQLAAYAGDWDAYRLLVLLSRLVPGALRPSMPPSFQIPEPRLLRVVERWAMVGSRLAGGARTEEADEEHEDTEATAAATDASEVASGGSAATPYDWASHPKWSDVGSKAKARLMEHQQVMLR